MSPPEPPCWFWGKTRRCLHRAAACKLRRPRTGHAGRAQGSYGQSTPTIFTPSCASSAWEWRTDGCPASVCRRDPTHGFLFSRHRSCLAPRSIPRAGGGRASRECSVPFRPGRARCPQLWLLELRLDHALRAHSGTEATVLGFGWGVSTGPVKRSTGKTNCPFVGKGKGYKSILGEQEGEGAKVR